MRSAILLLVLSAAVLGGCTSAYKTGQTPDDVYYSPARQHDEYAKVKENDEPKYKNDDEYYDDQYLRMKVHNRVMWSDLDDYYYYNPRYSYSGYSLNWSNPWTPFTYWNFYYNPYASIGFTSAYCEPSYVKYHPRMVNLNTYNNNQLINNNYTNPKGGSYSNYGNYSGSTGSPRIIKGYTPSNSNSGAGSFLRNIFNGGSSNNSSYSPSSSGGSSRSSSSGSSGGGGGSAPVRRF